MTVKGQDIDYTSPMAVVLSFHLFKNISERHYLDNLRCSHESHNKPFIPYVNFARSTYNMLLITCFDRSTEGIRRLKLSIHTKIVESNGVA